MSGAESVDTLRGVLSWIPDVSVFARLGDSVLQGRLDSAYADPFNQAGPLQIVLDALLLGLLSGLPGDLAIAVLCIAVASVPLVTAGVLGSWMLRRSADPPARHAWLIPWLCVLVMGLVGADEEYVLSGHWWQIPVLLLWVAAVLTIGAGHPFLAGTLVGLAAGLEPWGVFGVLAALTAASRNAAVRALISTLAVAVSAWIPFVVSGSFRIGDFRWSVRSESLWALVLDSGSDFPWSLRLIQACLVVGIGALATIRLVRPLRVSPEPRWLTASVLFAVVLVLCRVATDIWFGSYYLLSPAALLVPVAVYWLFQRHPAGLWLAGSAWLVLVGASGVSPFLLSAVALTAVLMALRGIDVSQRDLDHMR